MASSPYETITPQEPTARELDKEAELQAREDATTAGLSLGGYGHAFAEDNYSTKGLYSHSEGTYAGIAFFGRGGTAEQRAGPLSSLALFCSHVRLGDYLEKAPPIAERTAAKMAAAAQAQQDINISWSKNEGGQTYRVRVEPGHTLEELQARAKEEGTELHKMHGTRFGGQGMSALRTDSPKEAGLLKEFLEVADEVWVSMWSTGFHRGTEYKWGFAKGHLIMDEQDYNHDCMIELGNA